MFALTPLLALWSGVGTSILDPLGSDGNTEAFSSMAEAVEGLTSFGVLLGGIGTRGTGGARG